MTTSQYQREWRASNPELRKQQRQRNYALSRATATKARGPWTAEDDQAVLARAVPDRELATQLGRSVQAIQIRRSRIRS